MLGGNESMLTPMMVQYLVGLCCLRHDPEAIEIILGDMVYDNAAEKERDVDVTITFKDGEGNTTAFKAAEVKDESKPLDVITIEQLCQKFSDMQQVTHKSIFSTSGYTEAAIAKAKYHSIELYTLKPWKKRIEDDFPDFQGVGTASDFLAHVEACLLYWIDFRVFLVVPSGPPSFQWSNFTPVFASNNKIHSEYANMGQYINNVIRRSTDVLCTLEPAVSNMMSIINSPRQEDGYMVAQPWTHSHTMDVIGDNIYLNLENGLHRIDTLTISGSLQWKTKKRNPEYFILENIANQKIFAGAAIADYGEDDGRMFALVFPDKGRELGIHQFSITEKQKNIIRKIKIK